MSSFIEKLRTDLGDQSLYDAVSQCNRCGYCEQVCPTYVLTGKEAFSGRGRNQIVRMMLEGKFRDPKSAEEALSTCLLCGACTTVCSAHVPTADLVLEGRRRLREENPSWLMKRLTGLLAENPAMFRRILKIAYFFKRIGLSRLAAASGVLRLLGLQSLGTAERQIPKVPSEFLCDLLKKKVSVPEEPGSPGTLKWIYFAPCGPNYLYPEVGQATVRLLKKTSGPGAFMNNFCCGLLHYNYGDPSQARLLAQKNIELFESLVPDPSSPVFIAGDCSSCVAFLKSYPQLFLEDPKQLPRAEKFSSRVRDIIELPVGLPPVVVRQSPIPNPQSPKVTYHDSCRARNGQNIVEAPRKAMRALCGENFVELPQVEWCCGGAGAFGFVHPELSDGIVRQKISNIASTQADVAVTSSTSCLIQLESGLKKYYPECKVMHFSQFMEEATKD